MEKIRKCFLRFVLGISRDLKRYRMQLLFYFHILLKYHPSLISFPWHILMGIDWWIRLSWPFSCRCHFVIGSLHLWGSSRWVGGGCSGSRLSRCSSPCCSSSSSCCCCCFSRSRCSWFKIRTVGRYPCSWFWCGRHSRCCCGFPCCC